MFDYFVRLDVYVVDYRSDWNVRFCVVLVELSVLRVMVLFGLFFYLFLVRD